MEETQPTTQQAAWELDSDEIASVTSEDLHAHRPNRWTGPKSTWRALTREERQLWRSLKQLQDRDLAVHLYNSFALKRRGRNAASADGITTKAESGDEAVWAPPRIWTAWPLRERQLPRDGLVQHDADGQDGFTFRKEEAALPSADLRDEVAATILRFAKERFLRRKRKAATESSAEVIASIETPSSAEIAKKEQGDTAASESAGSESSDKDMDMDGETPSTRPPTAASDGREAVVSANDELSQNLLEPLVRHILSQLDKTLTVLHNMRSASMAYGSESSTSEDDTDNNSGTSRKRGRGRPRLASTSEPPLTPGARRRGRPPKAQVMLEGETPDEMRARLARQGHRRLPATKSDRQAAFEAWLHEGDERLSREQSSLAAADDSSQTRRGSADAGGLTEGFTEEEEEGSIASGAAASSTVGADPAAGRKRVARLGLGDWSDVLGAAATAGFSDDVIARTARRCANLFGEAMVVRRFTEAPASRGAGFETVEYRPEAVHLGLGGESSELDSDTDCDRGLDAARARGGSRSSSTLAQRRIASRQASLLRSSQESGSERGRSSRAATPAAGATPPSQSGSRSASRSSAASGKQLFCPVARCERSARGFDRRANLARHVARVHRGYSATTSTTTTTTMGTAGADSDADAGAGMAAGIDANLDADVDSDDEMLGAVHVDGFLRPIRPGRGWRGEDVAPRRPARQARRGSPPTRGRRRGEDDGDDEYAF